MIVFTVDEAQQEFSESVAYYESKEPGLGVRFRNEVATVIAWISRNPEVPRLRARGYRRVNFHTFPHYVAYVIRGDPFGSSPSLTDISVQSSGSEECGEVGCGVTSLPSFSYGRFA